MSRRVLISAYACEPGRGSEPEVGWRWVQAAAANAEIVVLVRTQHLAGIHDYESEHGDLKNITWIGVDGPWKLPLGSGRSLFVQLHYQLWQHYALRRARELHQQQAFDCVHHVTFVTFIYPSLLWRLDCPFIYGPIAGADRVPAGLRCVLGSRWRVIELIKDARDFIASRLPSVRACVRQARAVIAVNYDNQQFVQRSFGRSAQVRSALCVEPMDASSAGPQGDSVFRVVYAGALLGWKGLDLALMAFALFSKRYPRAHFDVIGSGRDHSRYAARIKALALDHAVTLHGQLPRSELIQRLADCDVMLFPSLRDSGGFVVVEALGQGCPVITRRHSGPGLHVRHGVDGYLLDGQTVPQLVAEIYHYLVKLMAQPFERESIRRDAQRFAPPPLERFVEQLYQRVSTRVVQGP